MTPASQHAPDPGPFVATGGLFWIIVAGLVFVLVASFVLALCAAAKTGDDAYEASRASADERAVTFTLYRPSGAVENVTFRDARQEPRP